MPSYAVSTYRSVGKTRFFQLDASTANPEDGKSLLEKSNGCVKFEVRDLEKQNSAYFIHVNPLVIDTQLMENTEIFQKIKETLEGHTELTHDIWAQFSKDVIHKLKEKPADQTLLFCNNGRLMYVPQGDKILTRNGEILAL